MGCLIEILMEAVFEGVAYGYAWLMTLIIPKHKLSKKAFDKIKTVVILFAAVLFVALVVGLMMWLESSFGPICNKIGRIIFIICAILIVAQIILGIISKIIAKRNKIEGRDAF